MPKIAEGSKYSKKYTEEDLEKALNDVKKGFPVREISRKYNIPRATLQFRKSDKFKKSGFGPSPVLSREEENLLVEWIRESGRKGFPRRKEDLQLSVKQFLDKNPRPNPFKDNHPHEGWYKAFLRRNPILTSRTPEAVTSASANVSEKDIRKWFGDIKDYLISKGYDTILNNPSRILNGDETCFNMCPKNTKVLAPRGSKNVYEVEHASSKMTITVMFTFSAAGLVLPPMIIFPGKRRRADIAESVPTDWGVGMTETGWMKAEVFYEYISAVLYPALKTENVKFPVILFVDGHSTHLTYELSELCKKLDIILICLYPNATRVLQPADVAAFKPIKTGWKKSVLQWRRNNLNDTLTKDKFAPILKDVIDEYAKSNTIRNGFKATGLFPFDADNIDFSKCLGSQSKITDRTIQEETDVDSKIITLGQFKKIIGNEKLLQLKAMENEMNSDSQPDLNLLYRIWNEFFKEVTEKKTDKKDGNTILEEKGTMTEIIQENYMDNDDINLVETPYNDVNTSDASGIEQNTIFTQEDLNNMPIIFEDYNEDVQNFVLNIIPQVDTEKENIEKSSLTKNQSLKNILTWPKTPKRKGTRDTQKLPYVLTGTQWREMKKEQEEEKERKERDKEERKQMRLEKKRKSQEVSMQRKKTVKKQTRRKDSIGNTNSVVQLKLHDDINFIDRKKEDGISYKIKEVSRDLFGKENNSNKINILSCISIPQQEDKQDDIMLEIGLSPDLNLNIIKGLCFSCTNTFSVTNYGVKCTTCARCYHPYCIKKYNLHKSNAAIFRCLQCIKVK